MNKDTFVIQRPDDETLIIYLNHEKIGYYNHDMHGWEGMEVAEDLVRIIARILNVEVQEK